MVAGIREGTLVEVRKMVMSRCDVVVNGIGSVVDFGGLRLMIGRSHVGRFAGALAA